MLGDVVWNLFQGDVAGYSAGPQAFQRIQLRNIGLHSQEFCHVMQLVLMPQSSFNQGSFVKRSKGYRINYTITRQF